MASIAFDIHVPEKIRYDALALLIYYLQRRQRSLCIQYMKNYIQKFPHSEYNVVLREVVLILEEEEGYISFY